MNTGIGLGARLQLMAKAAFGSFDQDAAGGVMSILSGEKRRAPAVGTKEILQGYSTMPWLRAAAGRVGSAVGSTEWCLYQPGRKAPRRAALAFAPSQKRHKVIRIAKQSGELIKVESHPLLDLLAGGNSAMGGNEVMKVTEIHLDLVGDAFWLVERNALDVPTAIYPLAPNWVTELPTKRKPYYSLNIQGKAYPVPVTEMIRFTDPDPANPFGRGSGLGRALADELQTDEFAAKLTKMRFLNSGRPDLIVSADDLKGSEVDRLETEWVQRHGTFWNAFKPFFARRKLDVQVINTSFADLQVMELRKHERDTIIQVWGVPPEILGILENSNRSTISTADFIFSAWVVDPRLDFLRRTLQAQLVPMFDPLLHLEYESPIDEDRDFKLEVMKEFPWAFTDDDARRLAGEDDLPDGAGQVRRVPVNLVTEDLQGNVRMDGGERSVAIGDHRTRGVVGLLEDRSESEEAA